MSAPRCPSPSPGPSPTHHSPNNNSNHRDDSERKSFQADHHRHRFMSFNQIQSHPHSYNNNNNNNNNNNLPTNQIQNRLGAPSNAHYAPHYGPCPNPPPRANSSKRKPPPTLNPSNETLLISPQHSPQRSPQQSPNLHSSSQHSPSLSPSPSPRAANLARKIGSVLTAPFRSAGSRRGSDASDISPGLGLGLADRRRSTSSNRPAPDRLPSMPSPATPDGPRPSSRTDPHAMTPAERVAYAARTSDSIVVVPQDERVLRVVNGAATTSTRASSAPPADADFHPTRSSAPSLVSCARCNELDARLDAESQRTSALERLIAEQSARIDQTRNWATAKVATLEQALRAHERHLEGLEGRVYAREAQPEVKSDYLIGLQRDVCELAARLGVMEQRLSQQGAQSSRSSSEAEMASTKPTSVTTSPPSVSPPMPATPTRARSPVTSTHQTPNRTRVWQPSSPAHLASKLVSPKSASRMSPQTPASRSPRPRYTTALGLKPTSPLNFTPSNSAQRLRGRTSETSPSTSRMSTSNPATPGGRRPSISNPTTPLGGGGSRKAEVGQSSTRALKRGMEVGWENGQLMFVSGGRAERRNSGKKKEETGARKSGERRVSATVGRNSGSPSTTVVTRMAFGTRVGGTNGGVSKVSRPVGGVGGAGGGGRVGVTNGAGGIGGGISSGIGGGIGGGVGGKKKPVGDLIKMFDGGK